MITLTMMIVALSIGLLINAIWLGLRFAWGATKFLFGLGLFWLCPVAFIIVVVLGGFAHLWLPILIVGLLFGRRFSRL